MGFPEQLQHIVNAVDGAIACSVMGFDGIAVETVQSKKNAQEGAALDLASAWVEFANLLSQVKAAAETLKTGKVTEVLFNTERVTTVMRMVTPDYFVVLGLLPSGNLGKGRYVLRIAAPKLAPELA
jgi:predicted regulator of Ras-like GTPase activity (Roadblock/LC7/MglB family)